MSDEPEVLLTPRERAVLEKNPDAFLDDDTPDQPKRPQWLEEGAGEGSWKRRLSNGWLQITAISIAAWVVYINLNQSLYDRSASFNVPAFSLKWSVATYVESTIVNILPGFILFYVLTILFPARGFSFQHRRRVALRVAVVASVMWAGLMFYGLWHTNIYAKRAMISTVIQRLGEEGSVTGTAYEGISYADVMDYVRAKHCVESTSIRNPDNGSKQFQCEVSGHQYEITVSHLYGGEGAVLTSINLR